MGATFGLMKQALDAAAGREAFGGGGYLAGVLLRRTVALAEESELSERWLGVLCAKTRGMFGPTRPWACGRYGVFSPSPDSTSMREHRRWTSLWPRSVTSSA